ncbi:hypothetical protein BDM02DRAFT_3018137 [Thelephora ganbajun]|uniref:Uncharacterized protein n=1 Tax=Thelephora ganbajun TaxID=370292 RepID=A0ACB6Z9S4_THEGA|nr:hypothetical protein BDM02DRAFT_3018137 [Thelephora ganbajun]
MISARNRIRVWGLMVSRQLSPADVRPIAIDIKVGGLRTLVPYPVSCPIGWFGLQGVHHCYSCPQCLQVSLNTLGDSNQLQMDCSILKDARQNQNQNVKPLWGRGEVDKTRREGAATVKKEHDGWNEFGRRPSSRWCRSPSRFLFSRPFFLTRPSVCSRRAPLPGWGLPVERRSAGCWFTATSLASSSSATTGSGREDDQLDGRLRANLW